MCTLFKTIAASLFLGCALLEFSSAPDKQDATTHNSKSNQPHQPKISNSYEDKSAQTSNATRQGFLEGVQAGQEWNANGAKMVFCWCPPGSFVMGSPANEPNRWKNENQAAVTLTRGFWLSKYEVTQQEFERIIGSNPSAFTKGGSEEDTVQHMDTVKLPVENVAWEEAIDFCRKLNELEFEAGRLPQGWMYTLPSEAQWEYACRAGTKSATSFGETITNRQANFTVAYHKNGSYYISDNIQSLGRTARVGSYPPNAWGICDMHGNVWEWCKDRYTAQIPGGNNPVVKHRFAPPVLRGGSWFNSAEHCRSAVRFVRESVSPLGICGFRVAIIATEH